MERRKNESNTTIGKNIKVARESAGITQEKLAEKVGVNPKSISALERGERGISYTKLRIICETLAVTSDSLIFEKSYKSEKNWRIENAFAMANYLKPEDFEHAMFAIETLLKGYLKRRE
ncbi:MAG: helix-turn-helix transcriptional regulator [Paenibacillus sp.]|uniref:helix-turn-helix domain-containing protein n=1 Tax=Paenibacillus sp. TaxID=58172 RepID=UPI0025E73927|nr:helix-turn-helix transcriptional regulator [Paenibacillus sp.]MBR2564548.1 helix-turn-helix transcriptional regulator [Paenibacillus sp.]